MFSVCCKYSYIRYSLTNFCFITQKAVMYYGKDSNLNFDLQNGVPQRICPPLEKSLELAWTLTRMRHSKVGLFNLSLSVHSSFVHYQCAIYIPCNDTNTAKSRSCNHRLMSVRYYFKLPIYVAKG